MTNFNDCKRDYFKSQQTTYSTPKQTLDYEGAALAEALGVSLPINITDSWRAYFFSKGYTAAYSTNLSDLWYTFLTDNGYNQKSLRGKLKAFYEEGSVNL